MIMSCLLHSADIHHLLLFRSEYVFNFDQVFELHQDFQVLKKMGLDFALSSGSCTAHGLSQAKSMLPKVFEPTLDGEFPLSALVVALISLVLQSLWFAVNRAYM